MNKINIMHLRSTRMIFGAEAIVLNLCRGLNGFHFNCIITCFQDPRIKNIELIKEAKKFKIQTEIIKLRNPFDIRAIFLLRKLINKYQINILHCHDYKSDVIGFLTSKFCRIKLVSTYHGWTSANIKVKLYEFFDSIVIKRFDKIIAVSIESMKFLKRVGIPEDKITVIKNAIDLDYFQTRKSTDDIKKFLKIPRDCQVVGCVGRLTPEKGHEYFIKAIPKILKSVPNTFFLITGSGFLEERLKNLTVSLGINKNVIFTGRCKREDMKELYSLIDIFVLPSLKETAGLAIMEAMSMGIPVVATKVDGPLSIVEDGKTGMLVPPMDSDAIAEKVIVLLRDTNKARKLAFTARNYAKKEFSLSKMIRDTEIVYKEVLEK